MTLARLRPPTSRSSESRPQAARAAANWRACSPPREQSGYWGISMRSASIRRNTKETQISGSLRIDGRGRYEVSTGVRFLDHMLELFAKHGGFDLKLAAS